MTAPAIRIETTETWDKGCQITLEGEIGRWDALSLDEELLDATDRGALVTVVDLSDVTHLEQIVVAVLLEAAGRQREGGGELFLAARAESRLGYALRSVSPGHPEGIRGLQPALDRALDRHVDARSAAGSV
jgi:anti-anti-sigma regulatory factor